MSAEPAPTPQEHLIPQVEMQRTCRKVISIHQAHGSHSRHYRTATSYREGDLLIKQCQFNTDASTLRNLGNKTIIEKIYYFYEVIKVNF